MALWRYRSTERSRLDLRPSPSLLQQPLVAWTGWVVLRSAGCRRPTTTLAVVLPPQSRKPLLLRVLVDVGANDKGHKVEERHPRLLWQELLGKRQADWRGDPANPHHGPKPSTDSSPNLVEGASAGDDSHEDQVNRVLNGSNLRSKLLAKPRCRHITRTSLTMILLTKICMIFALTLVRPLNTHCRRLIKTWPMGALMNAP